MPVALLGTLTFISSEVVFFGSLLAAFAWYAFRDASGPSPASLDVMRTGLFSLALFASSGTALLAERRLRRADGRGFRAWLIVTIVLGAVFLVGQVTEYAQLLAEGASIGRNLFTSTFYTLTGFHGAHVLIGLVALATLTIVSRVARGRRLDVAAQVISTYWHFVDIVWVVLFGSIYLWPRL
jgi:heme/copper-type cytochrome/quinol oxidase subunit 3